MGTANMIIFILFHVAVAFYNESCYPDSLEQADLCIHDCQEDLLTCLRACNGDKDCNKRCESRDEDCRIVCPCHMLCPLGCPCDHYECMSCEEQHEDDIKQCIEDCVMERVNCNLLCDPLDLRCFHSCINNDYHKCLNNCPCLDIDSIPCDDKEDFDQSWDDILYNVNKTYLDQEGFQKYFSALASDEVALKDHMFPPENAQLVFMGCGEKSSSKIKLGIIATPDDIFTQATYSDQAKPVKNFFTYYNTKNNEVIGFSLYQKIYLNSCDTHDYDDENRMCAHTTSSSGNSLWRCGNPSKLNRYDDEIVFYYK